MNKNMTGPHFQTVFLNADFVIHTEGHCILYMLYITVHVDLYAE
jgi:hypothetical protein